MRRRLPVLVALVLWSITCPAAQSAAAATLDPASFAFDLTSLPRGTSVIWMRVDHRRAMLQHDGFLLNQAAIEAAQHVEGMLDEFAQSAVPARGFLLTASVFPSAALAARAYLGDAVALRAFCVTPMRLTLPVPAMQCPTRPSPELAINDLSVVLLTLGPVVIVCIAAGPSGSVATDDALARLAVQVSRAEILHAVRVLHLHGISTRQPSRVSTPAPVPPLSAIDVSIDPTPVTIGQQQTITAETTPDVLCMVNVVDANGRSARGDDILRDHGTASNGEVFWDWVPQAADRGTVTATISCAGSGQVRSGRTSFVVH